MEALGGSGGDAGADGGDAHGVGEAALLAGAPFHALTTLQGIHLQQQQQQQQLQ